MRRAKSFGEMAEWLKAHPAKGVWGNSIEGSNPSPPINAKSLGWQ